MALTSIYDDVNNTTLSNNLTEPQEPDVPDIPPDDFNLYGDLHNADLGEKVIKLQKHNEDLTNHITRLNKDVEKLCGELMRMKGNEEKLKRNISELFNTAKTEIARKDRMIADLRKQNDDLLFKRRSYVPNGKSGDESNSSTKKRSLVDDQSEEAGAQKRPKYEPMEEWRLKNNVAHQHSSEERSSSRSYSKSPRRQERSRSRSKYDNRTPCRSRGRDRHYKRSNRQQGRILRKVVTSGNSRDRQDNRFEFRENAVFKRGSISGKNSNIVITEKSRPKRNEYLRNLESKQFSTSSQGFENIKHEDKSRNYDCVGSKSQNRENCEKVKIKQEITEGKHEGSFVKDEDHNSQYWHSVKTEIKEENLIDDYFKGQYENFELIKNKNTKQEVGENIIHNDIIHQVPSKMNQSKIQTETVNSTLFKEMEANPSHIASNSKETKVKQEVVNVSENNTEPNLNFQIGTVNSITSTEKKVDVPNNDLSHIANNSKDNVEQLTSGVVQNFNSSEATKLHSENGLPNEEKQNEVSIKRVNANSRRRRRCVITIVG